jgi:hypothetical protein
MQNANYGKIHQRKDFLILDILSYFNNELIIDILSFEFKNLHQLHVLSLRIV